MLLYYSIMHLYHMSCFALPMAGATLRQCWTIWTPALVENEWFPDALTQEVAVTLNVPFRLTGEICNLTHQRLSVCKAVLKFAWNSVSFEVFIFVYFHLRPYCRWKYLETLEVLFTSRSAREARRLFGIACHRWALGSISAAHREQQRQEQR